MQMQRVIGIGSERLKADGANRRLREGYRPRPRPAGFSLPRRRHACVLSRTAVSAQAKTKAREDRVIGDLPMQGLGHDIALAFIIWCSAIAVTASATLLLVLLGMRMNRGRIALRIGAGICGIVSISLVVELLQVIAHG
jgi:hypothetical protein